jgi:hypothetical protein
MVPVAAGPSQATLEGREFLSLEVLVLPLSDDGGTVTSVLGAVHVGPLRPIETPEASAEGSMAFPANP